MKLVKLIIENYRGYTRETEICFNDLTVIIGKNDIGKSTILEAMDLFFNDGKGTIRIDKADVNIYMAREGNYDTVITAVFADLPEHIIIDSSAKTSLYEEFLLNQNGELEIKKIYKNGGSPKVYIHAVHPTRENCAGLLLKKNDDLRRIVVDNEINCENLKINSCLRKAIWNSYKEDLNLQLIDIEVNKEDAKRIWEKLSIYLPVYSLFQSDRKNSDSDNEVQDPLKEAVREILHNESIMESLSNVAEEVRKQLKQVADDTLMKLQEFDISVARSLNPVIPEAESLKWQDVFKSVSISGDEDIPINKRGSGIKRLILLSFFRGEIERRLNNGSNTGVIYAIEEPETSQHSDNQKKLIETFKKLAIINNVQVVLTTHSSYIVKQMEFSDLRVIREDLLCNKKSIEIVNPGLLRYPSLDEVNYIVFDEATEEYHDQLYSYIDIQKWWDEYKKDMVTREYIQIGKNNKVIIKQITLTEYIRHQIHHPENTYNLRYTYEELVKSINEMRRFLEQKLKK